MSIQSDAEEHGPIVPQSLEAERALIRCVLIPKCIDRALAALSERGLSEFSAFLAPVHRHIWTVAAKMHEDRLPVDLITMTQALRDRGLLETCGGPGAIADLFTYDVDSVHNMDRHAEILLEKHRLRQCITLSEKTRHRSFFEQDEASAIMAEAAEGFSQIAQIQIRARPRRITELMCDKMERLQREGEVDTIVPTGIAKLDRESPVKKGDMPLILAAEKVGKSMLAISMAANMVLNGRSVVYFTLEMTADQQFDRFFHGITRIPMVKDHMKHMTEEDYRAVERANPKFNSMRFDIRDDLRDLASILCSCREYKRQWPDLSAIFVDYAQLICGERLKGENREREIGGISRALRSLSLELGVAIFTLSQVNKDNESRESKTLEQDATAIWLLSLCDDPKKRMLGIPRQRNGESGVGFPVTFLGNIARVEDFVPDKP